MDAVWKKKKIIDKRMNELMDDEWTSEKMNA